TQQVIEKSIFGAGVPSGPIPTGYGDWFLPPETLPYLKPDIEEAKKLMADAGYPDGKGIKVSILCSPQYPEFVQTAVVAQQGMQQLGVDVSVEQVEWGVYVDRTDAPKFDYIFATDANTFRPDHDGYIYATYHSKGNLNEGGYNNPDLDKLIDQARTISDHDQRKKLYLQIQTILEDDLPNYWWYVKFSHEAMSNKLQGYTPSFTGRRLFLYKAWLNV